VARNGQYTLTTIADGADGKSFRDAQQAFVAGSSFAVDMLPYGGFVGVLKR
jgi:hypothetical protein